MMKCIPDGPIFIKVFFKFPVIPDQIMDSVVNRQSNSNTGNKTGCHGKLDTEPPHDSEINNNWKQIGNDGDESHFDGQKED